MGILLLMVPMMGILLQTAFGLWLVVFFFRRLRFGPRLQVLLSSEVLKVGARWFHVLYVCVIVTDEQFWTLLTGNSRLPTSVSLFQRHNITLWPKLLVQLDEVLHLLSCNTFYNLRLRSMVRRFDLQRFTFLNLLLPGITNMLPLIRVHFLFLWSICFLCFLTNL